MKKRRILGTTPKDLGPRLAARETLRMARRRAELANPTMLQTKTWRYRRGANGVIGNRARTVNLTTSPGPGGVGSDPRRILSYRIRAALRPPDPWRSPGPVRRIDPTTGQVIETLDPHTGKPI